MMPSEYIRFPALLSPGPEFEKMDLDSMRVVGVSINRFVQEFLYDPVSWANLRARCVSLFGGNGRDEEEEEDLDFEEFSNWSAPSNLYQGIEGIEGAVRAKRLEECASRLLDAVKMLQVPVLLDGERGDNWGGERLLISTLYFYLSVVKKLQKDDWQVARHFLQALLVSPRMAWEKLPRTINVGPSDC